MPSSSRKLPISGRHTLSSKTKFSYKDGRRLANDQNVAYILPSDKGEVDRLKLNHEVWKLVLHGLYRSPLHKKLQKGIRVLDIGCGPGWWTVDMARLYPNSQFVGIDMADIFVSTNVPRNVTFQIVNAGQGLPYPDDSFDFVFQRFLVMGFSVGQYKRTVGEMGRILKPDGAIEILELVNAYKNAGPAFTQLASWINQAMESRAMDSFIANKISGFLSDAGFEDIHDISSSVPIGAWGGKPGKIFHVVQRMALRAVQPMVTGLTCATDTEYTAVMEDAFAEAEVLPVSSLFRLIYAKSHKTVEK